MPRSVTVRKLYLKLFLSGFLILLSQFSFSQGTKIQILGADEFEYNDLGDKKIKTLTGNVRLQQDDVFLFCDKAIL
ncbi:MAG: OstA-like protein, partial [Bacteroidota bacterium]